MIESNEKVRIDKETKTNHLGTNGSVTETQSNKVGEDQLLPYKAPQIINENRNFGTQANGVTNNTHDIFSKAQTAYGLIEPMITDT